MKKVIGIELCQEAIADAKANAQLNSKYHFLAPHFLIIQFCESKNINEHQYAENSLAIVS